MLDRVVKEIIVGRGIKKRIKKGKEDRHFNRSSHYGNEMRRRERRGEIREQTKREKTRREKIFLS